MKIIKEGNLNQLMKVKRFECQYCNCIFEANKDEYKTGTQYNDRYYYCECPYCKNKVYLEDS